MALHRRGGAVNFGNITVGTRATHINKNERYVFKFRKVFEYHTIRERSITCWVMQEVWDDREFYLFKNNTDRRFCINNELTVEEHNSLTADQVS